MKLEKIINSDYNFENISNSDIQVHVGNTDELSPNNIYDTKDLKKLEKQFTKRLKISNNAVQLNFLPEELQNDFEIKSRISDGELEYYTSPKTKDAYLKHPFKLNMKLEFPSVEEANNFKECGFDRLQEQANKENKAILIPYVTNLKEYLGKYENPTSIFKKEKFEKFQMFILPKTKEKSKTYIIEMFNEKIDFELETSLTCSNISNNESVLSNDSENEPFDIKIRLKNIKLNDDKRTVSFDYNFSITLKEKYKKDCYYNMLYLKYYFLLNDANSIMKIKLKETDELLLNFNSYGNNYYDDTTYEKFLNTIELIKNVIYISKVKNIKIDYDLNYFKQNDVFISILIAEINNRNITIDKPGIWTITSKEIDELTKENMLKEKNAISIITSFSNFSLFEYDFKLKKHRLIIFSDKNPKLEFKKDGNNEEVSIKVIKIIFEIINS